MNTLSWSLLILYISAEQCWDSGVAGRAVPVARQRDGPYIPGEAECHVQGPPALREP